MRDSTEQKRNFPLLDFTLLFHRKTESLILEICSIIPQEILLAVEQLDDDIAVIHTEVSLCEHNELIRYGEEYNGKPLYALQVKRTQALGLL